MTELLLVLARIVVFIVAVAFIIRGLDTGSTFLLVSGLAVVGFIAYSWYRFWTGTGD